MAYPSFAPRFHPPFFSTSHEGRASLGLSLRVSFTILLSILAHSFHSPVKTRCGLVCGRPVRRVHSMLSRIQKFLQKGGEKQWSLYHYSDL
jgi:hypothetical protein